MESKTMNIMTKTTPWVVASLLVAATVFGDDKYATQPNKPKMKGPDQSTKSSQMQMMPGYNAPARTDVRGSWDVYASGSFIYWQINQDNMEVAFASELSNVNYLTHSQVKGTYTTMDCDYLPGFKIGLGMNFDQDNWDAYGEYTMLHGTNSTSVNGVALEGGSTAPLFPTAGNPSIQGSNVYNSASGHWRTNFDIADLNLGRMYYVGTCLTFRPAIGLRAAWILQNMHQHLENTAFTNGSAPVQTPGTLDVYNRTHSWAIGSSAAWNTNWMVGQGIRVYGNASADLLYTQYKIQSKTNFVVTSSGASQFNIGREKVSAVRTHLDLELGLGWGSYFDNNNWHIDLSASYGFQVFFDQNMFPQAANSYAPAKQLLATGNLYAQGLTANLRLDF